MIIQISSGQGPGECELAVSKLFDTLKAEYEDLEKISEHRSRYSPDGGCDSITFRTDKDLSELEGSILWICKSPLRPGHARKNWYVDVSILEDPDTDIKQEIAESDLHIETYHSSGKGGQNVNKVETGVRITHIPTGITVTSTAERSQYLNKQDAMKKLKAELSSMAKAKKGQRDNNAWREHTRIVRGNPVRVYVGEKFKRSNTG